MAIWITGDTHNGAHNPVFKDGRNDMSKLVELASRKSAERPGVGDFLIIVGDAFGVDPANEPEWLEWLDAQPWTTLFIEGNHENYDVLGRLPTVAMFGDEVGKMSERIFHLRRGHIYLIEGLKFFAFGGAESADKATRFSGIDWWPEEVPSTREVYEAFDRLAEHDNTVDIVLTHAAPRSQINNVSFGGKSVKIKDPTCDALQTFWDELTFTRWFCGHYHIDEENGNLRFLYQDMVRLTL